MEPHRSANSAWFVVVEGGGWIQVADEKARVAAGEAVLWPADLEHAAWTELSEMRAFMVEFAGADDTAALGILEGRALELTPGGAADPGEASRAAAESAPRAEGSLTSGSTAGARTAAEGEPL
jgi:hypothetical protein